MKRFAPLIAGCMLMANQVAGQSRSFDSYNDALERMLSLSIDLIGCSGLVAYNADVNNSGNLPDGFNELSAPLQRHCVKEPNGLTGSTTAGGFSDPYSTRTFLPFGADAWSPDLSVPGAPSREKQTLEFAKGSLQHAQSVSGRGGTLIFGIGLTDIDRASSEFELGRDGLGLRADLTWINRGADDARWGFGVFFETEDTDLAAGSVIANLGGLANRSDAEIASLVSDANDACATLGTGSHNGDKLGANAFYARSVGGTTTLELSASVSRARTDYSSPLCIYRVGENDTGDILFFGTINGAPKTTALDVSVRMRQVRPMEAGFFVPRVSLTGEYAHHEGYTESETAAPAGTGITNPATISPLLAEPTGAALIYESRDTTSVIGEIGATMVWPFSARRSDGVFWVDAALVQTLLAPDRTVTARFAGDGRANPSVFTFEGNPVDHTYARFGAGVDVVTRGGMRASFGASTLLDHDYDSSYAINAVVSWQF